MFILLEKERNKWQTPTYFDAETFDSQEEAQAFADENDLIDVAIFEFKGFI